MNDIPNAETRQAMQDVDKKKNLKHSKTIEEFWLEIGIDPSRKTAINKNLEQQSQ